jgi:hypothetical protein
MQGSGAADGINFLRIETSVAKNFFARTKVIVPMESNDQFEPNCRYRITAAVRRNDSNFTPVLGLDEVGSAGAGNVASQYFSPEVAGVWGPPTGLVNSWYDLSFEHTTAPEGIYTKSWYFTLYGFSDSTNLPAGSLLDFDNVRLELLERKRDAILIVGNGASIQYFSNTDCKIQFVTAIGGTKIISVTRNSGAPSNIGSALVPGKYWTIQLLPGSLGTFTAHPIFSYTDLELSTAGMSEANLKLIRRPASGDAWTEVTATINTTANTIQPAATVTSFSEWAIATSGFPVATTVEQWKHY